MRSRFADVPAMVKGLRDGAACAGVPTARASRNTAAASGERSRADGDTTLIGNARYQVALLFVAGRMSTRRASAAERSVQLMVAGGAVALLATWWAATSRLGGGGGGGGGARVAPGHRAG